MSALDERMRDALRQTAEQGEPVDASSSDALAAWMGNEGAREIQRTRRRRTMTIGATVALAAALPLAFWLYGAAEEGDPAPIADRSPAPSAPAPALACADRSADVTRGSVSTRRDLGYAAFEPSPDSALSVVTASSCALRLRLDRGSVTVHARDLAGGTLEVETPGALVTVHGTIFRVSLDDSAGEAELEVSVAEGRVSVRTRDGEVFLGPGEAWRSGRVHDAPGASRLRAEVEAWATAEPPSAPEPRTAIDEDTPSAPTAARPPRRRPTASAIEARPPAQDDPDALAIEAEAARRRGDLRSARDLYRRAGAGTGATSEGAWIRLARLELNAGRPGAAARALASRERFGPGLFGAEAGWLTVQVREAAGDTAGAARAARRVLARHPGTPQAQASRSWLDAHAP